MRLFVGNLAFTVSDKDLRKHLETNGFTPTESRVMMDRETGQSRGFAFVSFQTEDITNNAVAQLNGSMLNGREVRVSIANDRPQRPNGNSTTQRPRSPLPSRNPAPEHVYNQNYGETAKPPVEEKRVLPKKQYNEPPPVYDEWGGKGGDRRRNDRSKGKRRRENDDDWD